MRLKSVLWPVFMVLGLVGCATSGPETVSAEKRFPASIGPTRLSEAVIKAKVRLQHTEPKGCSWVAVYKAQGHIDTPAASESGLFTATSGIYTDIVEAVQTYGGDVFVIDSATVIPEPNRTKAPRDEIIMAGRIFKCQK